MAMASFAGGASRVSTSWDKTTRALFPPPPPSLENYVFKAGMLNACSGTRQRPLPFFLISFISPSLDRYCRYRRSSNFYSTRFTYRFTYPPLPVVSLSLSIFLTSKVGKKNLIRVRRAREKILF